MQKKTKNNASRPVNGKKLTRRRHHLIQTLIGLAVVILTGLMFPGRIPFQYTDLQEGDIAKKTIIAPYDFPILMDQEELQDKREEAREGVIPLFDFDQQHTRSMLSTANHFFSSLEKLFAARYSDSAFYKIVHTWPQGISDKTVALLRKENKKRLKRNHFLAARGFIRSALQEFYTVGIVKDKNSFPFTVDQAIYLMSDASTKIKTTLNELVDYSEGRKRIVAALRTKYPRHSHLVEAWIDIFNHLFHENVIYNLAATRKLQNQAAAQVPLSKGIIYKDEKVLDAHKRVSKDDVNILRSLARYRQEKELGKNILTRLQPLVGRMLSSLVLIAILAIFLIGYRPQFYFSTRQILLLAIIFCVVMALAAVITLYELPKYLIPIALASMLIAILYDIETACFITITLCLLIGNIQGFDYKIALVSFVAGFTAILSVMRVRHRSEFYRSMLLIPLAYIVTILMIGLLSFMPVREILRDCGYGIINGLLSTILTIGILPICESLFKKSTDITLLELSDLNRPLLKQLALDAPGTYHHRIIMCNVAEAGAEQVGANSLLARVAYYYHDIGKLSNPEYFVENQKDFPENKHDKLSPSMSSLVLSAHAKNGLERAKKHRLPEPLLEIIQQHHGTSLMTFFYQRALETKEEDQEIAEQDFRYPGPKPQTKEAGIVMLADSVEAASRTLRDPTTTRLKGLLNDIIEARFRDGQLDECELTFKELNKITERFLPVLTGIFHTRIDYPDQKQAEKEKKAKKVDPKKGAGNSE
jgi:putative nucleotidyltransferase with HDIG domain